MTDREQSRPGGGGAEKPALEELEGHITQAKLGDRDACFRIYDAYADRIYGYVVRLSNSREEAEDITQETFFRVFTKLRHLRDNSLFEPWLFKIARNEIYKKRARGSKIKADALEDDATPELHDLSAPAITVNPEGNLLAGELGRRIQRALDSLPRKYRECLILATVHGFSYKQIADIVGRSPGAVKTDVYRARILMAEEMGAYFDGR